LVRIVVAAGETGSDDDAIELPVLIACADIDVEPGPSLLAFECADPLAPPTACAAGSGCLNVTLAWQRCVPAELAFRTTRWTLDGDLIYAGNRAVRVHPDGTVEEPITGEFLEWMAAGPGLALNWGEQISLHPEGTSEPAICIGQP